MYLGLSIPPAHYPAITRWVLLPHFTAHDYTNHPALSPYIFVRDGRLRYILAVAGTASLTSMLDALGKNAKLPQMVKLLDPEARTAAVTAFTDTINNAINACGTSIGAVTTSTSGPAGSGYAGSSGSESEGDAEQEIDGWDARRKQLAGDTGTQPPPTVVAAAGTG